MSRLNAAALMQPQNGQPGKQQAEIPEIDIGADQTTYAGQDQQQQPPEEDANVRYLREISEQLGGNNNRQMQEYQQTFNQLAQDPLIQQALIAKNQGKKMKLIEDVEQDPTSQLPQAPNEEDINWEELAQNPQKLAGHITKTTIAGVAKSIVPLVTGMLNKHLEPLKGLTQQVQQMSQTMSGFQQERVQNEINTVRNQNPALFDQLKPTMAQLSGMYPNMPTNDLFNLAAAKTGVSTANQNTSTERPNQTTSGFSPQQPQQNARQQALAPTNGQRPNGMHPNQFFKNALSSALDRQFGN